MQDFDNLINIDIDDAPDFIKNINSIIIALIDRHKFEEVSIIKIENWFDHKWLNYSGKSVVQFHGGQFIEAALQDEWREKITVPPFNPNRVLSEKVFITNPSINKTFDKRIHRIKASNDNLHNRIIDYSDNGLFVWYSSNTQKNTKGSVMFYKVQNRIVDTFFVSFESKKGNWEISKTKNISMDELKEFSLK